ncbi:hypothetical protein [uncultured Psychroserpens sp.]|uniref:hypothetical protein n=1 Tax=uncultured Psychroserpens sp. TaxID=255436 RepID=UPI00260E94EF|nr:hypothetical protein [uncultured Psychroserpens sp.]
MIGFFRKIRQVLLKKNRFTQYLLYAVGEIVLVMIGILLAMQINNLNEKRKLQKTLNNTFRIISDDLKTDTLIASNIISYYEKNQKNSLKIINREFTKDNYSDCMQCFNLVTFYQPFNTQSKGISQLKNIIDGESKELDSLVADISKFYSVFEPNIKKSNDRMENVVMSNVNDFQEFSWFVDMSQAKFTPELIAYFTTSEDYRKRVVSHNMLAVGNHLGLAKSYKASATELIQRIESRLKDED